MLDDVMIMVAPNGARRTKADHPQLPITPDEVAKAVLEARECGAVAAHVHARDARLHHTLDAGIYGRMLAKVSSAVGQSMIVQMTTEAVGRYSTAEQIDVVRALKPDFVSIVVREFVPDEASEPLAGDFFLWLQQKSVAPQFIVFSAAELSYFIDLKERGLVPFENPFLLFVLGRYSHDQQSTPADLEPFLEVLGARKWPFMLCAFGRQEAACMRAAVDAGGHVRVGFENNLFLPDNSLAHANADLVQIAADEVRAAGKKLMAAEEARGFLKRCLI